MIWLIVISMLIIAAYTTAVCIKQKGIPYSISATLIGYEIRNCKHRMGKVPRNRSPTGNEDKHGSEQGDLA